jgi:hypothetical protein
VPIRVILAHLAQGDTVENIVQEFPTVSTEDVRAIIAFAAASAAEDLPAPSPIPSDAKVSGRDDSPPAANDFDTADARNANRIVTGRDDSTEKPLGAPKADRTTARRPQGISAPTAGLEPATRRLTAACSTN